MHVGSSLDVTLHRAAYMLLSQPHADSHGMLWYRSHQVCSAVHAIATRTTQITQIMFEPQTQYT